MAETICHCVSSSQRIKPGVHLQTPSRYGSAAEWMMAVEGQSTRSQTGWSATKTEGMGVDVFVGSSARLRIVLGVKAKGREMCECWMKGFKTRSC